MKKQQNTTEGNIDIHLIKLAVPLICGNILQQFYNTVDALVVGYFAGKEEFAAIGIAGTVMNLFLFAIVGACTGVSVLFARYYGAGDKRGFRRQHFTALTMGLLGSIILGFMGIMGKNMILQLIQTPPVLLQYGADYLKWIFLGIPAAFLYNLYASVLRSAGDVKAALFILAAAVCTNLGLDLWFVAGLHLGIQGAAVATALTQMVSAVLCIGYIFIAHRDFLFHREDCCFRRNEFQTTFHFAAVTALHQSGLYIGKMLVQGAVNTAGTDVISAYTAATRIEGFANSFGDSGSAATSIVTAQNFGAGKEERVRETFWKSLRLLTVFGILCAGILFITAQTTMGFMIGNKTDGAFLAATGYLKIVALFYVFCFTGNTFAGYFDGIGRVNIPFIGAVGHITLRVILSWIFVSRFQLNAVAVATGIGWVLVNLFWSGCYFYRSSSYSRN